MRDAASRTFCTAGTSRAIRMAMIAITTSSSISVKARRRGISGCSREWVWGASLLLRHLAHEVEQQLSRGVVGRAEQVVGGEVRAAGEDLAVGLALRLADQPGELLGGRVRGVALFGGDEQE